MPGTGGSTPSGYNRAVTTERLQQSLVTTVTTERLHNSAQLLHKGTVTMQHTTQIAQVLQPCSESAQLVQRRMVTMQHTTHGAIICYGVVSHYGYGVMAPAAETPAERSASAALSCARAGVVRLY